VHYILLFCFLQHFSTNSPGTGVSFFFGFKNNKIRIFLRIMYIDFSGFFRYDYQKV